jgi:hypothetical protein
MKVYVAACGQRRGVERWARSCAACLKEADDSAGPQARIGMRIDYNRTREHERLVEGSAHV